MKILIITQKVDQNDDVLGFFHGWVAEVAKHAEQVTVIALGVGEYNLPNNVRIFSLGKECGVSRFGYIFNFYRLIWSERKNYDTVFVHMNQEYVLLGGPLWKLLGKKITMWRNHYDGTILTNIAAVFCKKIFCTSRFSYTARYKKTVFMPVGVDEESAHLDESIARVPKSILFLGRLDVSKRPDLLIDALGILVKQGVIFTATFVGGPSKDDAEYPKQLRTQVQNLGIADRVTFVGAVPNTDTYRYYRSHDIFVNCSRSGMFDKTIFEAIVCGCLVLVTSRDFVKLAGEEFWFLENDADLLAKKLTEFLILSNEKHEVLANVLTNVIKIHSLPVLGVNLAKEMGG